MIPGTSAAATSVTLPSNQLGPQSQPHTLSGTFEGRLFMYFGETGNAP